MLTSRPSDALEVIPPTRETPDAYGLTYQRPDGNRFAAGRGSLPDSRAVDIALSGMPVWVVGAPLADGTIWAAVLEDGRVETFQVFPDGRVVSTDLSPRSLPAEMPPLLYAAGSSATLIAPPADASPLTHPILLGESLLYIDAGGVFRGWDGADGDIEALPDARIALAGEGGVLFLSDPTSRYAHDILGDPLEAESATIIGEGHERSIVSFAAPDGKVFEGTGPIWADLSGDGLRELILTASDGEEGAQIIAYNQGGEVLAAGSPVGQGGRWRHQIAVAPFGPQGELELAAVLTPHIDGTVEFYRLEGDNHLRIAAKLPGYTSHVLGSRNLDMAAAGDFDGDGRRNCWSSLLT